MAKRRAKIICEAFAAIWEYAVASVFSSAGIQPVIIGVAKPLTSGYSLLVFFEWFAD